MLDLALIADAMQRVHRDVLHVANAPDTHTYPGSLADESFPLVLTIPSDGEASGSDVSARESRVTWQVNVFLVPVSEDVTGTDNEDNLFLVMSDIIGRFVAYYTRQENINLVADPHTYIAGSGPTVRWRTVVLSWGGTQAYGLELSVPTVTHWYEE